MRNTRRRRQSKRRVATQRLRIILLMWRDQHRSSLRVSTLNRAGLISWCCKRRCPLWLGKRLHQTTVGRAMMRLKNRHAIRCGTTLDLQESVSCCFPFFFLFQWCIKQYTWIGPSCMLSPGLVLIAVARKGQTNRCDGVSNACGKQKSCILIVVLARN